MSKKVYKYATGYDVIPEGAIYLCTKTETLIEKYYEDGKPTRKTLHTNLHVWHYFLVEVEDES